MFSKFNRFYLGLAGGASAGLLVYTIMAYLVVGRSLADTSGFADSFAKKTEIAARIGEPKIIFVGGSSVDLGISAEIAGRELNRPAVNFGLISPLGAEYILARTRQVVKSGDLVVLSFEYYCYDWPGSSSLWIDPLFVKYVVAQDSRYFFQLPWWHRLKVLLRVTPGHIATALLRGNASPVVFRKIMNSNGDRIDNTRENRPVDSRARLAPIDQLLLGLSDEPKGFSAISDFIVWANANDVAVMATFPNVCLNPLYKSIVVESVDRRIREFYQVHGVEVVGTLSGAMFSEADCFDSSLHLTNDAVERRTRSLVIQLANRIQSLF